MKKFSLVMAAVCCSMALSATTYNCHLKVIVNGTVTEQNQVPVEVTNNNGAYDLDLKNFVLIADDAQIPVGNITVNGVEGVDEFGYTTITYNEPVTITEGNDTQYDYWLGPMLGEVPIDLTARFVNSALSANIGIEMGDMSISVEIFGVAPVLKGDVNNDQEVNISDVNEVVDIMIK